MTPDLRFYPVSYHREAATRMPNPKVVHPSSEYGIDYLNHLAHWLADMLPEDFPELGKKCLPLLLPGHQLRSPFPGTTQDQTILKSQECETSAFPQIDYSTLFLVDLHS